MLLLLLQIFLDVLRNQQPTILMNYELFISTYSISQFMLDMCVNVIALWDNGETKGKSLNCEMNLQF